MNPIDFPGTNCAIGKGQDQYNTLPAIVLGDPQGTIITCWEFSVDELDTISKTGKLYISFMTFGRPMHPVLPTTCLSDLINPIDHE